jgi:hypothetical protein
MRCPASIRLLQSLADHKHGTMRSRNKRNQRCCAFSCARPRSYINIRSSSWHLNQQHFLNHYPQVHNGTMSRDEYHVLNPGSSFSIATLICGPAMVLLAGFAAYHKRKNGQEGPAQIDIAGLILMIVRTLDRDRSCMNVLTTMKVLIIAGTICSVVQARSGLGYATSFSSDPQRRAFQKVFRRL